MVEGRAPAPNINRGACLSNARQIVERGLGFSLYARYPVPKDPDFDDITAATAETAWKAAGLAVAAPLPGDLLFTAGDSPAGHVGLFLGQRDGQLWVLENSYTPRGVSVGGQQYIRLTPLSKFGPVRSIIRFPDPENPTDPAAPTPPQPERPEAPLSLPLVDLVNTQGAPTVPTSPKVDYTDPLWLFNTLDVHRDRAPAVLPTNLGPVSSLVILRTPYADEAEYSMPVVGPLSVAGSEWRATLEKTWASIKKRFFQRESWGRYYAPIMEFSLNPDRYRLPLPDVTEISIEQDVGGNAWADVTLHIGDHEAAEMVLATLAMGQRFRNLLAEVWVPVSYHDRQHGERTVLEPMHVGIIEEVTTSTHPHSIHFRVLPQDAAMNAVGMSPDKVRTDWNGATIARIIEEIAADHKLLIVTASAPTLGDVPALQRVLPHFNALGRPPLDTLRELVERAGGLRFQRLAGTELAGYRLPGLPRGVWAVIDPTAYHPFSAGFWRNSLWSKVYAPLAAAVLPDRQPVGEVAVIAPQALLDRDPKYTARIASILETFGTPEARRNPLYKFLDALASIGAAAGVGAGPAVYRAYQGDTRDALIDFVDATWTAAGSDAAARVVKLMVPALTVNSFAVRSPDSISISAPMFGTATGAGLQGRRVQAGEAGELMGLEAQPDGTFLLSTPGGKQNFRPSEKGVVFYGRHLSRPSLFAPSPLGAEDVEQVPGFYPYTVEIAVAPTAGVRAGMLAVLVGMDRLDGAWQIQSCRWALTGGEQTLTLTLRCMRDLYGV